MRSVNAAGGVHDEDLSGGEGSGTWDRTQGCGTRWRRSCEFVRYSGGMLASGSPASIAFRSRPTFLGRCRTGPRVLGAVALLWPALSGTGAADVYTWVDGQGTVHFQEDAPPTERARKIPSRAPVREKSGIPVTGTESSGVELLDDVMLKFLEKTGSTAAALAVGRRGVILHSRGYGWSDREKTVAMQPNTMIGIASCDKPITAAAVRRLAREGRLSLDAPLFDLLKIRPQGPVVDDRVKRITIRHLLEHKAGWGADPAAAAMEGARRSGFSDPVPVELRPWSPPPTGARGTSEPRISLEALLGFVMTQRLENPPGARSEYSNFGFAVLRHVIAKVTRRPYVEFFRRELFRPDVVDEFKAWDMPRRPGHSPLVWNAETGGLSASGTALLAFMNAYWLTGEPRDDGNPLWVMYGSLPGSTALMIWRPDGTDVVALFNSRSSATHDEIRAELESVVERLK